MNAHCGDIRLLRFFFYSLFCLCKWCASWHTIVIFTHESHRDVAQVWSTQKWNIAGDVHFMRSYHLCEWTNDWHPCMGRAFMTRLSCCRVWSENLSMQADLSSTRSFSNVEDVIHPPTTYSNEEQVFVETSCGWSDFCYSWETERFYRCMWRIFERCHYSNVWWWQGWGVN